MVTAPDVSLADLARPRDHGSTGSEPVNHPLLYQVNTRVFLQERSVALERPATLDDVTDAFLDDVAGKGFGWVWFLGVWQTGRVGREISRTDPKLVAECRRDLPDLREQDITGSPFAIVAYGSTRTSAATRRWRACAIDWRAAG